MYDSHLEIQNDRHGPFDFIYLFFKYHWKVFNCEVNINVLNPKLANYHLTNNSVDGKHNLFSVNHISSDLEGHQVQDCDLF